MANTKAKRHIHKYYKARTGVGKTQFLWACALSDCSHHMPKHTEVLLPGKATLCWKCEEQTVLDGRTMDMDKPLCEACDPTAINLLDTPEDIMATIERLTGTKHEGTDE